MSFVGHRLLQSFQGWILGSSLNALVFLKMFVRISVSAIAGMNLYTCKARFKNLKCGQKTVDDLQKLVTTCKQYLGLPTA